MKSKQEERPIELSSGEKIDITLKQSDNAEIWYSNGNGEILFVIQSLQEKVRKLTEQGLPCEAENIRIVQLISLLWQRVELQLNASRKGKKVITYEDGDWEEGLLIFDEDKNPVWVPSRRDN